MARRRHPPEEARTEVLNMTPMIDVVFQLLIFFMLSMNFRSVEGRLVSQLPKDKGPAAGRELPFELKEIRIVLCAGGNLSGHLSDQAAHRKEPKSPDLCRVRVEQDEIGDVHLTEKHPDKAPANRAIWTRLGERTRRLYDALPSSRDPARKSPVILDADSEVPYEHIVGALNACKAAGLDHVEFVGNPRFEKYGGAAPPK